MVLHMSQFVMYFFTASISEAAEQNNKENIFYNFKGP